MIIVTGGAGFIGSALVWRLNQLGITRVGVVDNLGTSSKWQNISRRHIYLSMHKGDFLPWLHKYGARENVSAIFHMGACSSTAEQDMDYLLRNNVHYSMELFAYCRDAGIPFIYASSAATYGNGEQGYDDDPCKVRLLRPINRYGLSKHLFDQWVLQQDKFPPFWAGLKFFNVYGPGEYHKEDMRSLVCKAVPQIQQDKFLRLFQSYRPGIAHGEQKRDFIYVKDVVEVLIHLWQAALRADPRVYSGLYNVGTGQAHSFADLARAIFAAMDLPEKFSWIEMPETLRAGYQYFTEAKLERLRTEAGYTQPFTPMQEAVKDYVCHYLLQADPYLS